MNATTTANDIPAIALSRLTFLHPGDRGVRDVDLSLAPGAILALLGPNGSGKSTILSLVAAFRQPQQGSVTVLGEPVQPPLRRRIGVLFQDSSLDPLMSVRETLWLHGRLFGLARKPLNQRIDELLRAIRLDDRATDRIETLSGGMKRRVELARAILHEPDVLLLDEPTLGLDPDSKTDLWALLTEINERGAALLVATNDVAEAEKYCHRVAFLEQGRVIAEGSPAELKRDLRRDSVRVDWPSAPPEIEATVAAWPGVGRVTSTPPQLHATVDDASSFVPALFSAANGAIKGIRIRESTLEDAYFQLVGTSLSAEDDAAPSAGGSAA